MKKVLFGAALVLACSVPVLAHHSPAAFDRSKEVKLVGTVKDEKGGVLPGAPRWAA